VIILAVAFLIYYSITRPSVSEIKLGTEDALAKCLTEKGIYLHGAYNCHGCEVQKEMFGSAVSFLVYINCDIEPTKCITGLALPYWNMDNNKTIKGPAPLNFLKDKAGC